MYKSLSDRNYQTTYKFKEYLVEDDGVSVYNKRSPFGLALHSIDLQCVPHGLFT
ncbi:hypothetical protein HMPREF9381_1181 [Streptococcus sanguinis SK72]|uniref:Uncharacterized protein n=1 Tax=Streptococcus sanguinis SK72 TaxID=888809 RepID=F0I1E0_STRSA|nr:hypothetical protein HMPREF9381_1181 [Streptococcus sanguinis SK72]